MKLSATQIEQIAQRTAELLSKKSYSPQPLSKGAEGSEQLVTRKELLDYLKISETTLWRYERENRLQAYSISGRRYFKKSEIDNLIQLKIKS